MPDDDRPDREVRKLRRGRVLLALLLLIVVIAGAAWLARKPIERNFIQAELARRDVQASYELTQTGLRWQRIEHVVIGDPRNPDLTADWAEVRLSAGFGGIAPTAIRASGVRLRGRFTNGRLTLGALDKLLSAPSGKPFTLPDLDVDLTDARMRLATDFGEIGAKLDGKGNLIGGFHGKLAAIAPTLGRDDCTGTRITAYVDVSVSNRQPSFNGPLRADAVKCAGVAATAPVLALNATFSEALDRWRGSAKAEARTLDFASARFAALNGAIGFSGSPVSTVGDVRMAAAMGSFGANRVSGLQVDGRYGLQGSGIHFAGPVRIARVVPDQSFVASVASAARSAGQTPLGPLLDRLAAALQGAARGLAVDATVAADSRTGATISRLVATGANNAVLRVEGGNGFRFGGRGLVADTGITLLGGDFPAIRSSFQRIANGETRGIATVAPFSAGNAALSMTPVRFAIAPSGAMRIETVATLSGPLGDGRVDGLRAPILAMVGSRGSVLVNPGCAPVSFQLLRVSGLTLRPATIGICPFGGGVAGLTAGRLSGGAVIAAPRLSGSLGSTPIRLSAQGARVALSDTGFTVDNLAARLGNSQRMSRLDIGRLSGKVAGNRVGGTFTDTSGQIGNVPLLIGAAAGDWSLKNGVLTLGGRATVSDEASPVRFNPLVSDNLALKLANGKIAVTGTLREPASRTLVADVVIAHDLPSGTGSATLDVASLRFGKAFQPETLTPLTLGVVANVEGALHGRGEIRWNANGVTSTGRFATDGFDLAAAFGPVTGLRGEIVFSDLLGLETRPGQVVSIDTINPGIPVTGGLVTYHLIPGQRIAIEGGRWPFAGGELLLDPAVLDMGKPSERRLTFRIRGLEAAKFIQQLEFDNLSATGVFDGVIPMIFDQNGGRIEGGRLVARPGGGTLAYVGEVSNAQLNMFAKLAFDALKSMRYRNLTIEMDGALDGEIVSRVSFAGVNQSPVAPKGFIARQLTGLPFVFNITIKAPFRGLLSTARTFYDPSLLLQGNLPVQPPESETKP